MTKLQFLKAPDGVITILSGENEYIGILDHRGNFIPAHGLVFTLEDLHPVLEFMESFRTNLAQARSVLESGLISQGLGRSPAQV